MRQEWGERRTTYNDPDSTLLRGCLCGADGTCLEIKMDAPLRIPLSAIAHGRSGDKGNHANVALIAYTPAGFAWLRDHVTAEGVCQYFASLGPSRVVRYEAPN